MLRISFHAMITIGLRADKKVVKINFEYASGRKKKLQKI